MKQKIIVSTSHYSFESMVESAINDGWRVVPESIRIDISGVEKLLVCLMTKEGK